MFRHLFFWTVLRQWEYFSTVNSPSCEHSVYTSVSERILSRHVLLLAQFRREEWFTSLVWKHLYFSAFACIFIRIFTCSSFWFIHSLIFLSFYFSISCSILITFDLFDGVHPQHWYTERDCLGACMRGLTRSTTLHLEKHRQMWNENEK